MSSRRVQRRKLLRALSLTAMIAVAGLTLAEVMFVVSPGLDATPRRVDAVVQLAGGPAVNYEASRDAAIRGAASYLIVSSPGQDDPSADIACSPLKGVEVVCFEPDPYTTQGESRAIANLADKYDIQSILVFASSLEHVARARTILARCYPGKISVRVHSVDLTFAQRAHQWTYQSAAWVKAFTVARSC